MAKKKKKPAPADEASPEFEVTYAEPALRDIGILGKPPSHKEQETDAHISAAMDFLDSNPNVAEVIIDLSRFYSSYLNPSLPGVEDSMRPLFKHALTNCKLVIQQKPRKPRTAVLRQVFMPSPFNKVQAFTEGVRAYLVPMGDDMPVVFHGEDKVTHRLAVEMDFDILESPRKQLLMFGQESGILEKQYCIYKSTGGEEAEQED